MIMYTPLYDYDQWWICAIQNVAIVKISFSSDQHLLQQTTKITSMYLLHTHSTKKQKISTISNENTIAIKFWCEFFTWSDSKFSLEAAVDLWGRVEFILDKKQNPVNGRRSAGNIQE